MKSLLIHVILILTLTISACKKDDLIQPVNAILNSENLDCNTCPSLFSNFESIQETTPFCDDFETYTWNPQGDTLGYTQSGQYPILGVPYFGSGSNGSWLYNSVNNPGMYGFTSGSQFLFDNSNQIVQFEIYGFYSQYGQMGFSVNGFTPIDLSQTFPLTIGNVTIDLDTSLTNQGGWENAYLTFTGEINDIKLYCFESGIVDLCITKLPPKFIPNQNKSIYFDAFYNRNGIELGNHPNEKTPLGYYSSAPTVINIDFKSFLGYQTKKISFVHAYLPGSPRLINIKLPSTPLIVTSPDSINYYLSPYNYEVEHYVVQNEFLWINKSQPPLIGATLDSIIIKGQSIQEIKIGAEMDHSEIRSICAYFD